MNTPDSFTTYMRHLKRHALLSRSDESVLAHRCRQTRCPHAAHRLVTANLRLVVRVAGEYRGYGAPLEDIVQEGNVGLVVAIDKFDPARGFRLSSYAVWWMRAHIHRYLMSTQSLVKIGTTQAQRKLFFRLRSERERLERAMHNGEVASDEALAHAFGVKVSDVTDMSQRMAARDASIDAPLVPGSTTTFADHWRDDAPLADEMLERKRQAHTFDRIVAQAPKLLNMKEQVVLRERLLGEAPRTLQDIANSLQLSRERIRQIERNVIHKLRARLQAAADEPSRRRYLNC